MAKKCSCCQKKECTVPIKMPDFEYMDMYADTGHKVVFMGRGGRDEEIDNAKNILKIGSIYNVSSVDVHAFSSTVCLKEFPGRFFNQVMFEELPKAKKIRGK